MLVVGFLPTANYFEIVSRETFLGLWFMVYGLGFRVWGLRGKV